MKVLESTWKGYFFWPQKCWFEWLVTWNKVLGVFFGLFVCIFKLGILVFPFGKHALLIEIDQACHFPALWPQACQLLSKTSPAELQVDMDFRWSLTQLCRGSGDWLQAHNPFFVSMIPPYRCLSVPWPFAKTSWWQEVSVHRSWACSYETSQFRMSLCLGSMQTHGGLQTLTIQSRQLFKSALNDLDAVGTHKKEPILGNFEWWGYPWTH